MASRSTSPEDNSLCVRCVCHSDPFDGCGDNFDLIIILIFLSDRVFSCQTCSGSVAEGTTLTCRHQLPVTGTVRHGVNIRRGACGTLIGPTSRHLTHVDNAFMLPHCLTNKYSGQRHCVSFRTTDGAPRLQCHHLRALARFMCTTEHG